MFFFFNDTATTEIYTLSLHDALPIFPSPHGDGLQTAPAARRRRRLRRRGGSNPAGTWRCRHRGRRRGPAVAARSEEHTSELQSRQYLVCRLLLEKTKNSKPISTFLST